jgi:hypothetical protein
MILPTTIIGGPDSSIGRAVGHDDPEVEGEQEQGEEAERGGERRIAGGEHRHIEISDMS